jgi:hypothetical protein
MAFILALGGCEGTPTKLLSLHSIPGLSFSTFPVHTASCFLPPMVIKRAYYYCTNKNKQEDIIHSEHKQQRQQRQRCLGRSGEQNTRRTKPVTSP